jgi:hypothetical protein
MMKLFTYPQLSLVAMMMLSAFASTAQLASSKGNPKTDKASEMKTYVIRRDIPDAGKLTAEELKSISQTSCNVLSEMGPRIEWLHSYVTGNNIYCIYKAENENAIREHAAKGGFPANEIIEVKNVISPATAELAKPPVKKKL